MDGISPSVQPAPCRPASPGLEAETALSSLCEAYVWAAPSVTACFAAISARRRRRPSVAAPVLVSPPEGRDLACRCAPLGCRGGRPVALDDGGKRRSARFDRSRHSRHNAGVVIALSRRDTGDPEPAGGALQIGRARGM